MPKSNAICITELDTEYTIPEEYASKEMSTSSYIGELARINKLPFSKGDIYYNDDLWDFSDFTDLNILKKNLKYNFGMMGNSAFKNTLKNYVLLTILENKIKLQSLYKHFILLKNFFLYIEENYHVYAVEDISIAILKKYLLKVRNEESITKLRDTKTYLKRFFLQYSAHFTDVYSKGMHDLFEQDNYREYVAYQYEHRSSDIPADYFDNFVSACVKVMNDTNASTLYRAIACVYIILAETGLRIGEILSLRTSALRTTQIFNGEETNYLEYETWKREDGNNVSSAAFTYINELTKEAFNVLVSVYADRRKKLGVDYLFLGCESTKDIPVNSEKFKRLIYSFFIDLDNADLLKTVDLPDSKYPGVHRFNIKALDRKRVRWSRKADEPHITTLAVPVSQQFRFHCCTVLASKGVPLEYIKRFMSHLTDDMVRYHILPTKSPQENMEFTLKTLREVVSGKAKILGSSKGLTDKIEEFIKKNNFHVEKDLDAICEGLAKDIPIRQKTGGVCIKSSPLRDCSLDAKTNRLYCAYGVCPNIVHFYYMADISYRQCKELEASIQSNTARGHLKQVQKEKHMLYNIATGRLIPELKDLKEVVQRDGVDAVYMEHPSLKGIIENLEQIEKEASEWSSNR